MTGESWWEIRISLDDMSTLLSGCKMACDTQEPDLVDKAVELVREHFPDFTADKLHYRRSGKRKRSPDPEPEKPKRKPKPKAEPKAEPKEPEPEKPKRKPKPKAPRKPKGLQSKLEAIMEAGIQNLLVVGPAGCGKTTLAQYAAIEFTATDPVIISCSLGTPAYTFTGRRHPITGEYEDTEFTKAYREGRVIILDEVDALDPAVACAVNAALANGHIPTPAGPIDRHEKTRIIATANTWGHGADRQYCGRNQLDAATLDRFSGGRLTADYDAGYEARYDAEVVSYVQKAREHITARKLRRIVSTRMIIACDKLKGAGLDWREQVTADWSDSERQGL